MRLDGRRESSNVEDRRGLSGGAKAGIGGIGGIIIIALFTFLQGGNVGDVVNNVVQQTMQAPTETVGEENFTEEEQELASDCKKILLTDSLRWRLHGLLHNVIHYIAHVSTLQECKQSNQDNTADTSNTSLSTTAQSAAILNIRAFASSV